jgi:DNA polymerase-1
MMAFEKAKCDRCPLKAYWEKEGEWKPVDFLENNDILILGEGPSKTDVEQGYPFSDSSAVLVMESVKHRFWRRQTISWGHIIGCRWPKDDPKRYLTSLRATNRKRKAKGEVPLLSPIDACSGHLRERIKSYKTIVPLGSYATKAILKGNVSLEAVRGGPTVVDGVKVLPTYAPHALTKQPKLTPVFSSDIAKAFRHARDELSWKDPHVEYNPDPKYVAQFFDEERQQYQPRLTYDVETDGIDALNADLRCIGIGTSDEVLIIGFVSIDGLFRFYSPEDEKEIKRLLCDVFTDESIQKVGHNAGYFDRLVVEQHLGVTPTPVLDTLLLHKLAASEYRHNLGFVGSVLTDVPAWKADHTGVLARTDEDLHAYCATDVAVTARIVPPLIRKAEEREQHHLYGTDEKLQGICVGMRRLGIRVDEDRRRTHQDEQERAAEKWINIIHKHRPTMNPNSNAQVRDLLYGHWNLPVQEYTETGDESVGAASLRSLIASSALDEEQLDFINALRFYRRAQKLLSTYLRKLAPEAGLVKDGYIHPDYNSAGTVTGRLSSSNPNFQNIPFNLRNIFVPPKGCVFVGADYDQLELRFASALAGAQHYLAAFEQKQIDPHNLTADLMFGSKFWDADGAPDTKMGKGKGQFKQLRNLAKTICFASLYGASAPKVHEIISRGEDEGGNLLYAQYTLRQIRILHRKWKDKAPEFRRWWNATMQSCRKSHYVEEVVLGRRRYFAMEDYNAILNFGVQAGGFAIVGLSMIDLVEKHLPFDFKNRTGLVNQLHDAVLFAVPESEADYVAKVITETLTRRVDGLPVTFTAEAEIGNNWREV